MLRLNKQTKVDTSDEVIKLKFTVKDISGCRSINGKTITDEYLNCGWNKLYIVYIRHETQKHYHTTRMLFTCYRATRRNEIIDCVSCIMETLPKVTCRDDFRPFSKAVNEFNNKVLYEITK